MKYEEIVQRVKDNFTSTDVSDYKKHLAIQFNITGEGEGAFYVELNDGSVDVQPYEYYDRDVIFTMSAVDLFSMIDGNLDATKAYLSGQIGVSNVTAALEVKKLLGDLKAKEAKKAKAQIKAKQETEKIVKPKAKKIESTQEKVYTKVVEEVETVQVAEEVSSVNNSTKKPSTKTSRAKKSNK